MKKNLQKGSAHLIVVLVLVFALIGSLGFVFYQNFFQSKDDLSKPDMTTQTTPAVLPEKVVNEFVSSYVSYIRPQIAGHDSSSFVSHSSAVTDAFKDSVINPDGPVMVDPLLFIQNLPDSATFAAGSAITTSNISSVPVTLNGSPHMIYSLILIGNEWKIDAVTRA